MSRNHAKRRNAPQPRKGKSGGGAKDLIWLWGTHAVAAAIANPARHIERLVASKNAMARGEFEHAERLAPGAISELLPRHAVHQGVGALVKPLPHPPLEEVMRAGVVCVLDQVTDPHNLGAIFRSAAAFGVGAVISQSRHTPPITGVVAKSAAGAVETVPDVRVVNIARALNALSDAGFHTVGLTGAAETSLETAIKGAQKLAIVLGAEGSGLRPAVMKACAEGARIPLSPEMESLNVSNAAAIAFYEAAKVVKSPFSGT